MSADGAVLFLSQSAERLFGFTPGEHETPDLRSLEAAIAEAARTWEDRFESAVRASGRAPGEVAETLGRYREAFPAGYRDRFAPEEALADLAVIDAMADDQPVAVRAYRSPADNAVPRSPTMVSYPFSKLSANSSTRAMRQASRICCSVASGRANATFSRMVPSNSRPVVEALNRQVDVFVGLQFKHGQPAVVRTGKHVY